MEQYKADNANKKSETTRIGRDMIFEYMLPSSSWSHTEDAHRLAIHIPGFKKEEVRIRAGNNGRLLVSGERQVSNENKIIHFQQAFMVPLDSAVSETSGNLQDGTFYITIPKKQKHLNKPDIVEEQDQNIVAGKSEHKTEYNQNSEDQTMQENGVEEEDEFRDSMEDDQWSRRSVLEKNGICTVVIALSLGVIFSAYLCNFMNQG